MAFFIKPPVTTALKLCAFPGGNRWLTTMIIDIVDQMAAVITPVSQHMTSFNIYLFSNGMAHVISFRCPSLIIRRTGLPYESTMAWILVLAPPRLWPISVGGPFFCTSAVLMRLDNGTIHGKFLQLSIKAQDTEDIIQDAILSICGSGCKQSPMGHNALAGRAMEHHCERSTPFR